MDDVIATHRSVEQSLRYLLTAVRDSTEAMAFVDVNGVIKHANAAWATLHGYNEPGELVSKQLSAFHNQDQMQNEVAPFIEEAKRRGVLTGPMEHTRSDGTPFFTQTKAVVVPDEQGQPVGLVLFATDTTESKRVEDELRQQCDQLSQRVQLLSTELRAANSRIEEESAGRAAAEQKLQRYQREMREILGELQKAVEHAGEPALAQGAGVGGNGQQ